MQGTVQILGNSGAIRPLPRTDHLYQLERNQILRVRDGKGAALRIVAGALWLTQQGDARDIVLEAGDDFVLDRNGLSVLIPLGPGPVRLVLGDAKTATRTALAWLPLARPRLRFS